MQKILCGVRTAREITVSFYTPHPALSPSRGEEDAVNYFSNGPKLQFAIARRTRFVCSKTRLVLCQAINFGLCSSATGR